jgi:hypothetical protein
MTALNLPFQHLRWFGVALRAALPVVLLGLLVRHTQAASFVDLLERLREPWAGAEVVYLLAALALMPLNWAAETAKWRRLLPTDARITPWKAFKAVCAGVAVSLFTPNRMGEYGGRILFIKPENQLKGIQANLAGNAAQLVVICAAGLPAAVLFRMALPGGHPAWLPWLLLPVLSLSGLLVWIYFNISLIAGWTTRLPVPSFLRGVWEKRPRLQRYSRNALSDVLYLAALRYGVYTLQYWFFLLYFGVKMDVWTGLAGIATLYLVQTGLPLPPLAGLFARGNLAVQLWEPFGADAVSCLAATFGLWALNLFLPALFGTFSMFYVNIAKALGYENAKTVHRDP